MKKFFALLIRQTMQKGSNKSLLKLEKKVDDLVKRIDLLEKSNRELRRWAFHEKKKVKIIPWLNEHFSPTKDFSQWIEELVVGNRGLQQVFANRFMTGAYYIILNNLPIEERDNFPIISFAHKRGLLYIYEDESWIKMKEQNFAHLIQSINIKLFKQFNIWGERKSSII